MRAGGDLSQIVSKSLRQILEVTQIQPESLVAAIDPCIHSKHLRWTPMLLVPLRHALVLPLCGRPGKDQRWNVDLVEANRQELAARVPLIRLK